MLQVVYFDVYVLYHITSYNILNLVQRIRHSYVSYRVSIRFLKYKGNAVAIMDLTNFIPEQTRPPIMDYGTASLLKLR
jgi:hypothetical protein